MHVMTYQRKTLSQVLDTNTPKDASPLTTIQFYIHTYKACSGQYVSIMQSEGIVHCYCAPELYNVCIATDCILNPALSMTTTQVATIKTPCMHYTD